MPDPLLNTQTKPFSSSLSTALPSSTCRSINCRGAVPSTCLSVISSSSLNESSALSSPAVTGRSSFSRPDRVLLPLTPVPMIRIPPSCSQTCKASSCSWRKIPVSILFSIKIEKEDRTSLRTGKSEASRYTGS